MLRGGGPNRGTRGRGNSANPSPRDSQRPSPQNSASQSPRPGSGRGGGRGGSRSGANTPGSRGSSGSGLATAYAYVPVDRPSWDAGGDELSVAMLYERIHNTVMHGQYSLFSSDDRNLPSGRAHGTLVQVACMRDVPFDNDEQKTFVHDGLLKRTRQLAAQYRREGR